MGASLLLLNNILLSGRTAAGLPSASCRTPRRLPRPGPMSTAAPSIRAQLSVWTAVSSPLEKRLVSFHPHCPGAWHMACEQTRERLSTPLAGPVGGGSLAPPPAELLVPRASGPASAHPCTLPTAQAFSHSFLPSRFSFRFCLAVIRNRIFIVTSQKWNPGLNRRTHESPCSAVGFFKLPKLVAQFTSDVAMQVSGDLDMIFYTMKKKNRAERVIIMNPPTAVSKIAVGRESQ